MKDMAAQESILACNSLGFFKVKDISGILKTNKGDLVFS